MPWGVLTVILGVISLTSIGALVVVTSVNDVDTLSTVALALAVLSFAAQLIVTMAQAQQSSQVSSETKSALARMHATTSSLLSNQREQFDAVLQFAFQQAIPAVAKDVAQSEAEESDGGTESPSETKERANELQKALETRVDQALKSSLPMKYGQTGATWQRLVNSAASSIPHEPSARERRQRELREFYETYPTQAEGAPLIPVLNALPPHALITLSRFVESLIKDGREDPNFSVHLPPNRSDLPARVQALVDAGLLEVLGDSQPRNKVVRLGLTPEGTSAARLLLAKGEPPKWWVGER